MAKKAAVRRTPATKRPIKRPVTARRGTASRAKRPAPARRAARTRKAEARHPLVAKVLSVDGRYGSWVTMAGVIAQMLGLATDLVLHRLNPTLAFEASPLTMDNPGHILLLIGLIVTVIGVVWMLITAGLAERSRLTVVAAFALAAFAVFAIWTGLSATNPTTKPAGTGAKHHSAPAASPSVRPSGAASSARPSSSAPASRPSGSPMPSPRPSGSPSR